MMHNDNTTPTPSRGCGAPTLNPIGLPSRGEVIRLFKG